MNRREIVRGLLAVPALAALPLYHAAAQPLSGEVVSIADPYFGAIGNGLASSQEANRAAVQAAMDYVLSLPHGGSIYAPTGDYPIASRISVPKTDKGLIFYGDGPSTIFRGGTGYADYLFHIGGEVLDGGVNYSFRDFRLTTPLSGISNGVDLQHANIILFERVLFDGIGTGVNLNATYAPTFRQCQFTLLDYYAIIAFVGTAGTNNLVIDRCQFFSVGGGLYPTLVMQNGSHNIVIEDSQFENCRAVYDFTETSAIRFVGNYVEYCGMAEFIHHNCQGAIIEGNWIALNTGGPVIYNNIKGGRFVGNTLYNQRISWGQNVTEFDVGANTLLGASSLGAAPWRAPVLSNGFSNLGSAWATAGYRKSATGLVHLRGMLTGSSNGVAFTLPVGCRPGRDQIFAGVGSSGSAGRVTVTTAGAVAVHRSSNGTIDIGSVSFPAA